MTRSSGGSAEHPGGDDRPRLDPSDLDVYACGINATVHGLVAAAERIGVPEARILSERVRVAELGMLGR